MRAVEGLEETTLPSTLWSLDRTARVDRDARGASVVRGLEDGPFYARALVRGRLLGEETVAMHEVLSGERLRRSWVRFLTGFRMRRTG